MKNRIVINIASNGNDAFVNDPARELARILKETAAKLEAGFTDFRVNDINGNSCGSVDHWED